LLSHVKNCFVNVCFVFLFIDDFFCLVSFLLCFVSLRFCFILFRFCCVSFRFISACFVSVSFLILQSPFSSHYYFTNVMLDCTSLFVKCIQLLVSKYTKYIVLRNSVWFSKELCHYLPGHPDIAEIGVQEY
jgi:hypothetical protein